MEEKLTNIDNNMILGVPMLDFKGNKKWKRLRGKEMSEKLTFHNPNMIRSAPIQNQIGIRKLFLINIGLGYI